MISYSFGVFTHQLLQLKLVTDVLIGKICGKPNAMSHVWLQSQLVVTQEIPIEMQQSSIESRYEIVIGLWMGWTRFKTFSDQFCIFICESEYNIALILRYKSLKFSPPIPTKEIPNKFYSCKYKYNISLHRIKGM